jgi:DNA-binding response OmpR family regulator
MAGKQVLVVDDEAHLTYILTFKLKQMGLEVVTASDGDEAYNLACAHPPDLIITDFQMPGLSGLDLCIKLKQTPATADIPILMLTARGHRVAPSDLVRTNIQHLMPKPFSARELMARTAELLQDSGDSGGSTAAVNESASDDSGRREP